MKTTRSKSSLVASVLLAAVATGWLALKPRNQSISPSDAVLSIAGVDETENASSNFNEKLKVKLAELSPEHRELIETRQERIVFYKAPKGNGMEFLSRMYALWETRGNEKRMLSTLTDLAEYEQASPRVKSIVDVRDTISRKENQRSSSALDQAIALNRMKPGVLGEYFKNQPDSYSTHLEKQAEEALRQMQSDPEMFTEQHARKLAQWFSAE